MNKNDLREVLDLVKEKLSRETETACGIMFSDDPVPTTEYSVGEEDATTRYAIGEEDATTLYSVAD